MKRRASCAACLAAIAILASCASAPYVQKESSVLKLVGLINSGEVTSVQGLTPAPFVLDTEILYLDSDVDTLWKNLKASSFAMTGARFVTTASAGGESWKTFADTYDMRNFFEKYTGKDTSIVTLDTAEGRYYLLLERKVSGYPRVRGMKGPIK